MDNGVAPNAKKLLWAGFLTIFAAGVGFGVRNSVLNDWGAQFGFTKTTLGDITGGGLTGFGVVIILLSLVLDRIGYKPLMVIAFLLHLASGALQLMAAPIYHKYGAEATYRCLYWGMFLFAMGNGTCEAVVNPLTATLFPKERTHYLNILHAGWPGGLVAGSLAAYFLGGNSPWELQMSLFLIPVLVYGLMMITERFPQPEVNTAGISFGESLAQFASPILLFLLVLHAMVGYVELGTDSWIGNITGSILDDPKKGLLLFVYTSMLMFALRFFAGPIVHKLSPLGLLFVCACLGATGLTLLGNVKLGMGTMCVVAATIYGLGKTFYWPTMLAVVSERFPKGGALTIGAMGGVGMLSAGLLGGPGIGYKQDYAATNHLKEIGPQTYERYKADKPRPFLFLPEISGLDGQKVSIVADGGKQLTTDLENLQKANRTDPSTTALKTWWQAAEPHSSEDGPKVKESVLFGGQQALRWTAYVPMAMAAGYLILVLVFKAQGGYRQVHLDE